MLYQQSNSFKDMNVLNFLTCVVYGVIIGAGYQWVNPAVVIGVAVTIVCLTIYVAAGEIKEEIRKLKG